MLERLPLLGGLALLAIALVIGSFAIGHGIRDKNRNDVISVTGSAKKRIVSDYIVWNLSVTSRHPPTPPRANWPVGPGRSGPSSAARGSRTRR